MPKNEKFTNAAEDFLDGGITSGATTLDVDDASEFPSDGDFRIKIEAEIIIVTAVSGNTFTVTRGQEGTSAAAHVDGTPVVHVVTVGSLIGFTESPDVVEGRLTLETGVPISISDQSAQTTLYFTPYKGNRIALYDGSYWRLHEFAEISVGTGGLSSSTPYDVFVYDNAGTLTIDLVAWTNDTTRATALATQDNVYVKSGATGRRYVGTVYLDGSTQFQDTVLQRYVWNYYNRVERLLAISDSTSHTYTSSTFRQWNNDSSEQVSLVIGVQEEVVTAHGNFRASAGAASENAANAIGIDGTTPTITLTNNLSTDDMLYGGSDVFNVGIGKHDLNVLESGDTSTSSFESYDVRITVSM